MYDYQANNGKISNFRNLNEPKYSIKLVWRYFQHETRNWIVSRFRWTIGFMTISGMYPIHNCIPTTYIQPGQMLNVALHAKQISFFPAPLPSEWYCLGGYWLVGNAHARYGMAHNHSMYNISTWTFQITNAYTHGIHRIVLQSSGNLSCWTQGFKIYVPSFESSFNFHLC